MSKYESDIDKFITVCKAHSIKKEDCLNLGTICCSQQMHDAGYSPDKALQKAAELIKDRQDIEKVYKEVLLMAGHNPDE